MSVDISRLFFQDWAGLIRTFLIGILAYFALVFLLRISGKRTLSKMNAFDLVVTVALGSTLATILLSEDVALAEGILALSLLIFLQFAITWLSVRSDLVTRLIKAEPTLLYHQGKYLTQAMKQERVIEAEVEAAVRAQGFASMQSVGSVVLETDGSFTVIQPAKQGAEPTALKNIDNRQWESIKEKSS